MVKYLLQHWHFYQPRGNDDWAKVVNKECYNPNSKNGILKHISFNIGPTLIDWFNKNDKKTLKRMIKANKGQAIAQPYNHRIMPLIRYDEDIKTQIIWGKKYFKKYFKKEPVGMWLPETATSKRVCKELAKQGIKYTIGAQWQQKGKQDTSKPFKISLGDGLEIIYFFYNPISAKIAFNEVTDSGKKFLDNVDSTLDHIDKHVKDNEMLLTAYDGETFGHHHKHGNKWAEYFPKGVKKRKNMEIITINDYLKRFKVNEYSDIHDFSSWSCFCGLKRWSKGCDCAGGHQKYQQPLLEAVEQLEDIVHDIFVNKAEKYLKNVWDARNDYIDLNLKNMNEKKFFKKHAKKELTSSQKHIIKQLLQSEYEVQLSFTSCGWFFPDINEQTERNIINAYNAARIISDITKKDFVKPLIKKLEKVEDYRNGKKITGKDCITKIIKN